MTVWNLYVGTLTVEFEQPLENPSKGIERFSFDDTDGRIHFAEVTTTRVPQYLVVHPTRALLYAAECVDPGTVQTFEIDIDGRIRLQAAVDSFGAFPSALDISPDLDRLFVANYKSGTFTCYTLRSDGQLESPLSIRIPVEEAGADREPRTSHPHHIRVSADGRTLLVADVGIDAVLVYETELSSLLNGCPADFIRFPSGSGPRHLEFHPSGRFVYVDGEYDSHLYVLEARSGRPTSIVGRFSTLPPGYVGKNMPSELRLHPSGHVLYVANRGAECITAFHLDSSGGKVTDISYHPSGGREPRGLAIDPTGQYLLVANRASGELVAFKIDADGGQIEVVSVAQSHSPSSLAFHR